MEVRGACRAETLCEAGARMGSCSIRRVRVLRRTAAALIVALPVAPQTAGAEDKWLGADRRSTSALLVACLIDR